MWNSRGDEVWCGVDAMLLISMSLTAGLVLAVALLLAAGEGSDPTAEATSERMRSMVMMRRKRGV
jgi:hypothetical protein